MSNHLTSRLCLLRQHHPWLRDQDVRNLSNENFYMHTYFRMLRTIHILGYEVIYVSNSFSFTCVQLSVKPHLVHLCRRPPQLLLGRTSLLVCGSLRYSEVLCVINFFTYLPDSSSVAIDKEPITKPVLFLSRNWFGFLSLSEQLAAIPEFSKLGPLFKSSDKPLELTESETEYVVRCIKHTFANHMVFQVRSDWSAVVITWLLCDTCTWLLGSRALFGELRNILPSFLSFTLLEK